MRFLFFRSMNKDFNRLMFGFFIAKLAGCIIMSLLIIYYWKVSDNIIYYNEAETFFKFISHDLSNIRYLFLPGEFYANKIEFDNTLTAGTGVTIESNFLVTRFCTLFYPFALGKYILINFFFCFISTIAQLKLYVALAQRYPDIKRNIGIAILFIPSVILYSSYINKETLCMVFIVLSAAAVLHIFERKKITRNVLIIVVCIFLTGIVKSYVLFSLIGAILLFSMVRIFSRLLRGSFLLKIISLVFITSALVVFILSLPYFDPYIKDFADTSNLFQQQYNNINSGEASSFEFGEVETSLSGLLKKAPLGIYTTYFRPQLWEVKKPIILYSALESFIVLIFALKVFFRKRKYFTKFLKENPGAHLVLFYILIFGAIVGLTTFNFGTLVRYRVPGLPFLVLWLFILMRYKPAEIKKNII